MKTKTNNTTTKINKILKIIQKKVCKIEQTLTVFEINVWFKPIILYKSKGMNLKFEFKFEK